MKQLQYTNEMYKTSAGTVSLFAGTFPSLAFYGRLLAIVYRSGAKAKRGKYDYPEWSDSSLDVLRALESVGVSVEITGIRHVEQLKGPCVVIANHMSILETHVLPCVIVPIRKLTFIIKQSLLNYPIFRHVMRSRDPVVVTRTNPRQDLRTVLEHGTERLKNGISIMVFPQTTRMDSFNPELFSTIGVKLAQKAGVPIIPVALLTDAWGNGKCLKDFGKIDPSKKVHFAFGEPICVQGRGTDEHQAVIDFISGRLREWRAV